jgi:hypothetical protein
MVRSASVSNVVGALGGLQAANAEQERKRAEAQARKTQSVSNALGAVGTVAGAFLPIPGLSEGVSSQIGGMVGQAIGGTAPSAGQAAQLGLGIAGDISTGKSRGQIVDREKQRVQQQLDTLEAGSPEWTTAQSRFKDLSEIDPLSKTFEKDINRIAGPREELVDVQLADGTTTQISRITTAMGDTQEGVTPGQVSSAKTAGNLLAQLGAGQAPAPAPGAQPVALVGGEVVAPQQPQTLQDVAAGVTQGIPGTQPGVSSVTGVPELLAPLAAEQQAQQAQPVEQQPTEQIPTTTYKQRPEYQTHMANLVNKNRGLSAVDQQKAFTKADAQWAAQDAVTAQIQSIVPEYEASGRLIPVTEVNRKGIEAAAYAEVEALGRRKVAPQLQAARKAGADPARLLQIKADNLLEFPTPKNMKEWDAITEKKTKIVTANLARAKASQDEGRVVRATEKEIQNQYETDKQVVEYNSQVKSAEELERLLAGDENGIVDTAAIVKFLKTLDPGSVARESEVEAIAIATGLWDRVTGFRKVSGTKLTDTQRDQLKVLAGEMKIGSMEKLVEKEGQYMNEMNKTNERDFKGEKKMLSENIFGQPRHTKFNQLIDTPQWQRKWKGKSFDEKNTDLARTRRIYGKDSPQAKTLGAKVNYAKIDHALSREQQRLTKELATEAFKAKRFKGSGGMTPRMQQINERLKAIGAEQKSRRGE